MVPESPDETRSLTALEKDDWGAAPPDATHLMSTVHRLRHVPVGELSPGDLRVLIGQNVGVDVLVPRALAVLRAEPLVTGTYYPGDLLVAVLELPVSYWTAHPAEHAEVERVLDGLVVEDSQLRADIKLFRDVTGTLRSPGQR